MKKLRTTRSSKQEATRQLSWSVALLILGSLVALYGAVSTKTQLSSFASQFGTQQTYTFAVVSTNTSGNDYPEKSLVEVTVKPTPIEDSANSTIPKFKRYDKVVIVTKIHTQNQLILLDQMLCLLHHAYNKWLLYDIVVFYTEPFSEELMEKTRKLVHPSKLTFVLDNRGSLHEEIAALSPIRRQNFLKSCNVSSPVNLTWWSHCPGRIAYNWQAEFRSWHIWTHPALQEYKYMLWLDSDGFCTEVWKQDPVQLAIENNLTILFDNFPMGNRGGKDMHDRIFETFGKDLCSLKLENGHMSARIEDKPGKCDRYKVPDVHGFFHITDLDFFRSETLKNWGRIWIGDGFLQREFDDQLAVTAPPAILTPNKAWDMRSNGIRLNVYHNGQLDGKERAGGYKRYYQETVKAQLPESHVCPIRAANR